MEEKSITHEILRVGIFLVIAALVVLAGWNEPLRYLFMKSDVISLEEQALFPPPEPERRPVWRPAGTALNRAPYRTEGQGIQYTGNFDGREMGTPTETDSRKHTFGKKR